MLLLRNYYYLSSTYLLLPEISAPLEPRQKENQEATGNQQTLKRKRLTKDILCSAPVASATHTTRDVFSEHNLLVAMSQSASLRLVPGSYISMILMLSVSFVLFELVHY